MWLKKKNERKPRDRILKYLKFHLCSNKLKYKFWISFSIRFHFFSAVLKSTCSKMIFIKHKVDSNLPKTTHHLVSNAISVIILKMHIFKGANQRGGGWGWVGMLRAKDRFPDSSVGKESACNAGDPGSIPGSGRSTGEGLGYPLQYSWASLVAQVVKNPPAMQETWVQSLGWEDPWRRERLLQ